MDWKVPVFEVIDVADCWRYPGAIPALPRRYPGVTRSLSAHYPLATQALPGCYPGDAPTGSTCHLTNLSLFYHLNVRIYHLFAPCAFRRLQQSTAKRPTFGPNRPIDGLDTMPLNLPVIYRSAGGIYRFAPDKTSTFAHSAMN